MSSVVFNIPSGYINAGLLLLFEILLVNIILGSGRKRLDSYHMSKSLLKGERLTLRQINILGIETRRTPFSIALLFVVLSTIIGLGIMEWGVNGESSTRTEMRTGFVIGGDTAIRMRLESDEATQLDTYGYMGTRPTGKFLEIRQKCLEIKFNSTDNFSRASENVLFSMQRAAVEKPSNPKIDNGEVVLNMSRSDFSCFGDKIVVRGRKDECRETASSSNWDMDPLLWNEEQEIAVWSNFFAFQTRKQEGLVVDSCLKKQGYSERYQIRINTFGNAPEYMVWDIHKSIRNKKRSYLLLQATLLEKNGTFRPKVEENVVEQYVEISSNIDLGHSIAVGCISFSQNDNNNFASEITDVFYSNLGNSGGIGTSFFAASKAGQKVLGESGIEQKVDFQQLPFQVPSQVTRIELWSLISFSTLLLSMLFARLVCEILWRRSGIKANVTSSEWLANEILKNKARKADLVIKKSHACVQLIHTADNVRKVVISDGNNEVTTDDEETSPVD